MARRATLQNLDQVIAEVLDEYNTELLSGLTSVTKAVGKAGAEAVRSSARGTFNGRKYAAGWTYRVETVDRLFPEVVIHNKTEYRLAHLLEYGHALKRGGRSIGRGEVEGRAHIKPVEERLNREFEMKVRAII